MGSVVSARSGKRHGDSSMSQAPTMIQDRQTQAATGPPRGSHAKVKIEEEPTITPMMSA